MRTSLVVHASPARLLRTISNRMRGLAPNAVALRRNTGEKSVSANAPTSRSTRTLHAARGGIDKAPDAGRLACPRQADRAEVVDRVSRALVQLAEGVVRQFSQMHNRVEPFDVLRGNSPHIPGEGQRPRAGIVVEPAVAVKAAIHPDNVKPLLQQCRSKHGADIAIYPGNQYPHSRHNYLV